jgi:hypothetical protein
LTVKALALLKKGRQLTEKKSFSFSQSFSFIKKKGRQLTEKT